MKEFDVDEMYQAGSVALEQMDTDMKNEISAATTKEEVDAVRDKYIGGGAMLSTKLEEVHNLWQELKMEQISMIGLMNSYARREIANKRAQIIQGDQPQIEPIDFDETEIE